MLNAPKGDYYSIPLNAEGKRVADTWDPAKDIAAGKQCLSYGAPNIMREPARLHITWAERQHAQNRDRRGQTNTAVSVRTPLRRAAEPSVQGTSVALWQTPQSIRAYTSKISAQDPNTPGFRDASMASPPPPPDTRKLGGTLESGHHAHQARIPPQQRRAVQRERRLTEYYDIHKRGNDEYLVQTQIMEDPKYLNAPWVVSSHFRREPDGSKWDPEPCELLLPNTK